MPKVKFPGFPGFPRFLNRPSGSGPLRQPLLDQDESRSDNANRYPNTNRDIVFLHACNKNDLDLAKQCLIEQPDLVNIVDDYKMTPLHIASDKGHLEIVKLLINAKPDLLDSVTGSGFTVLHLACDGGHLEVVKELIKAKPDLLNKVNKFGKTAIFMASETDNKEALELLIKKGADIYKCDSEGISPIHVASLELNSEIVEMLFNAGANIELGEKEKIEKTIKEDFDEYKLINLENINASIQNSNVNSDELDKKQKKFDAMNLMLDKITNPIEIQARDNKLENRPTRNLTSAEAILMDKEAGARSPR